MMPTCRPRRRLRSLPRLLAAAALVALLPAALCAGEAGGTLRAALLTKELGDPRAPGNAKLVLGLPDDYAAPHVKVTARDFQVYVYPAGLSREEGMADRYRAGGLYLWRSGSRAFLDARVLPVQDREGPARVRVVFAPGGEPVAEGEAEGSCRYTSDLVDVVLAVDTSLSMKYNDPNKRRVTAARTFIEMARKGGGIGRVGLVTFNQRASLGTPLIPLEDGERLLAVLDGIGAAGTTNLDEPLDMALRELDGSRNPVVILLSDGKNEGHNYEHSHLDAAEAGVRIFSVGLSEQADHDLLRDMADATDGIYFRAVTDDDLPEIYARLAAELGKRQLLQARRLDSAAGTIAYPIDATVGRLVGMIDGGARLGVTGPGADLSAADRAMSSVYMGSPTPGRWEFAWENAAPDVSVLALFGDTPFFLDVFPPQLRGETLHVGATLAHGARALTGGQVWLEPLPGVLPRRLQLFDDGRHGDGEANDGVYGASTDLVNAPDQFDLVLRAAGRAWDKGEFVRQAAGMAIRSTEPPSGHARLGGDVDFGTLFPGETGTGAAHVDLDAPSPRELYLDLSWDGDDEAWPDMASSVTMEPGARDFELEITVPLAAEPGDYRGDFRVGDGGDLADHTTARVRVGTVRFDAGGEVDLGVVPPGTFASGLVRVAVDADKAAPLRVATAGSDNLGLANPPAAVDAGRSEIDIEVIVSAPIGQPEGEYRGRVVLEAGPGRIEIPLVWRVRPYSAKAEDIAPIPGLPQPPALAGDDRPLEQTPELSPDFWEPRLPQPAAEPLDSPWERANDALRTMPRLPQAPAAPASGYHFPGAAGGRSGDSFWSAWWLYILAALLLLLLLLLLLAYLLYRLGKSALARWLLASALANAILLAVFILLLGTAESVTPRTVPAVAVNLVENAEPIREIELTETEKELLASTGNEAASASAAASAAGPGEPALDAASASASGGELVSEKAAQLPDGMDQGLALADADRDRPAAVRMDGDRDDATLRRRERRQERRRDEVPVHELPEMDEPPPELAGAPGAAREVGEAKLELEASETSDRPVWSEGRRPVQPLHTEPGLLAAEMAGMEKVALDPTVRAVDPRGRRHAQREMVANQPEPRVQINDPIRDAETETVARGEAAEGDPGVEEMRAEVAAAGPDIFGEKPGAAVPPGASQLTDARPMSMPRGIAGTDTDDQAAPRGGRRSHRGTADRAGAAQPGTRADVPGGDGEGEGPAMAGASGRGERGGVVGERRFDGGDGDADGDVGDMADGLGSPRLADAGRGGGGTSPSPLGGGGRGDRAEFQPGEGDGGGLARNDGGRRGQRGGTGDNAPQPGDGVPGGSNGTGPADDGTDGRSGRSGRAGNGAGEGRFDDMAAASGGAGGGTSPGEGVSGNGRSQLDAEGGEPGLGIVSLPAAEEGWSMSRRPVRRRQATLASSSVDMDSLLIVVGDFARLPDSAANNLFAALTDIMPHGLMVEERRLAPGDANLADALVALVTPEEMREWTDGAYANVAVYLKRGGHLWLDADRPDRAAPYMEKLARAVDGDFGPLPADHQLAGIPGVDALYADDRLAAVVTYRDWRKNWRYGRRDGDGTLDFFRRSLNYFLSGNADQGIVLDTEPAEDGRYVQPSREVMPDLLAGGTGGGEGELWDDFGSDTAASWRMPSWSDPGRIAAVADGQGGRALRVDLGAADKGRTAAYRTLTPPQDFSDADYITLDAYYDGEGDASVSMVFTVERPEGWQDYETPTLPLVRGWNRIRFNLGGRTFRALAGGGAGGQALPDRDRTGRAGFFLYRDAASPAVALFRDIRVHRP